MEYPERVTAICKDMAQKHGSDIDKAVASAEAAIRKLPDFDDFVHMLITLAIRELICDARHHENLRTRKAMGSDVERCLPKTTVGTSKGVIRASQSIYNYNIGGTMLGMMTAADVESAMNTQHAISNGHRVNYLMLKAIYGKVPEGKIVKQVFTQKQLIAIRQKAEQSVRGRSKLATAN